MTDASSSQGRPPLAGDPAPGNGSPAMPGGKSSEDVLDVLQEFEIGLESLKQLYAQRQALAEDLKRRTDQMASAEADLRARREELASREREITQASSVLEDRRKQLEEREQACTALRRDAERRLADVSLRERTTATERAQAEELLRTIDKRAAEADARHAELDKIATELELRSQSLIDRSRDLEARVAAANQTAAQVRSDREALRSLQAEVEQRAAQAQALREAVESQQRELDARRTDLERDRARTESLAVEIEQQRRLSQHSGQALDQLREECRGLTERLAEADRRLLAQADQLAAQRNEHEKVVADLRARARDLESQLGRAAHAGDEHAARAEATERTVEEMRGRLDQAEKALAASQTVAAARDRELREALACCEELRAKVAAAEALRAAAVGQEQQSEREAEADHDALADRLRKACEALVQLRNERTELVARAESLEAELGRARALIDQLKATTAGANYAHPVALQRRRNRLSIARQLLVRRGEKVRKAEDALATRFAQCERVLAMRQELADARELLNAAQKKVDRARASGRTAALAFYGSAAAALLGVLSWFGTQAVIPGQYAARAIISADNRGRALGPGEYAEWQTFHEAMINDARFLEVAAERMERRGILDLARAADLKAAAKEHLAWESGANGEIMLEWRDQGSERSFRVLDTFVTALTSHSNAARERRVDGAVTKVTQPATAGTERLDTDYRLFALGAWGGSMIVCFGLAGLIWRSMANAKATFEGSATVDAALDMRRWQTPSR